MIVTIDGPAAAGKSSAAKALAERLGFDYLDTGAMYRAVTLAALRRGVPLDNEAELSRLAESLDICQRGPRIFLDGQDVTDQIRDVAVSTNAWRIADSPGVRRRMVKLQRQAAVGRDIVAEGRDQGTVVFPDAECKVFLTASPEVRADRRQQELAARGVNRSREQVLAEQGERDRRDVGRAIAPLVPAPDALVLDSTHLDLAQVVAELERLVRASQGRRTQADGTAPAPAPER